MKREIKFRAWDKKDKMMYYNIQKGIKFTDLSQYNFDEFLGNPNGMGDYHEWEVMQFTGLKDKNGVEIYEGDIVSDTTEKKYQPIVVYSEEKAMFELKLKHRKNGIPFFYPLVQFKQWFNGGEVIGNIYENPNLTKKGKQ